MTKYINADKVIDYANQEVTAAFYYPQDAQKQRKQDEQAHRDKWTFVKQVMVGMPAADVVEVVRCKECANAPKCFGDVVMQTKSGGNLYCPLTFCSEGKRKDG